MKRVTILLFFVVAIVLAYAQSKTPKLIIPKSGVIPENGFVADADVARVVAEAVLTPVYGEEIVRSERPFTAVLKGGVWLVKGTVPCVGPRGAICPGGASEVWISKKTGQILYMTHDQ